MNQRAAHYFEIVQQAMTYMPGGNRWVTGTNATSTVVNFEYALEGIRAFNEGMTYYYATAFPVEDAGQLERQLWTDEVWRTWAEAADVERDAQAAEQTRREALRLAEERRRERAAAQLAESQNRQTRVNLWVKRGRVRSRLLLFEVLTDEQRRTWLREHCVYLKGSNDKNYAVRRGNSHNVSQLVRKSDGELLITHSICGYTPGVPHEDNVAAQVIQLRTDANRFLASANVSPMTAPWHSLRASPEVELQTNQAFAEYPDDLARYRELLPHGYERLLPGGAGAALLAA